MTVAVTLCLTYGLTLAPDVTFWDAGEFNAAIATLGIPHPPGTPLYILIGNVWAGAFGFLPQALAVNLLSAVATAVACGLLGSLTSRWTRTPVAGVAAGLSAGTMLTVWRNATETEVYALALLLAILMIVTGEAAGRRDSAKLRILLAFLIALAVPLHLSALTAAPAAIMLATTRPGRVLPDARWIAVLGGALTVVIGFSLGAAWLVFLGMLALVWSAFGRSTAGDRARPLAIAAAVVGGLSVTAFMLVRAPRGGHRSASWH